MPGFRIDRDGEGRRSLRLIGCCGDPERMRRDYDQAFLEQTLAEGGTVVSSGPGGVELRDRRGCLHRVAPGVTVPSI
jgi:hypothetical protein